jgi:hypothetical protein
MMSPGVNVQSWFGSPVCLDPPPPRFHSLSSAHRRRSLSTLYLYLHPPRPRKKNPSGLAPEERRKASQDIRKSPASLAVSTNIVVFVTTTVLLNTLSPICRPFRAKNSEVLWLNQRQLPPPTPLLALLSMNTPTQPLPLNRTTQPQNLRERPLPRVIPTH